MIRQFSIRDCRPGLIRTMIAFGLGTIVALAETPATQTRTNAWPHFQEVLHLLRGELRGVTEPELNEAMVEGMLKQMHPRVLIDTTPTTPGAGTNLIARSAVLEGHCGYVRIQQVASGLEVQLKQAIEKLTAGQTNVNGLVLDLRFAGGIDFSTAAKTASSFVQDNKELFDFGEGMVSGGSGTNAIQWNTLVLVNGKTTGAAEGLAALLRQSAGAVILGNRTANQASVYKSFQLSNGRKLQIASGKVVLADGRELSKEGVIPDLTTGVGEEDERMFLEDPYRQLASRASGAVKAGSTNNAARRRINEAELVRRQREGVDPDEIDSPELSTAPESTPPARPVLRDPTLARAVDLIKGLNAMQKAR